VYGFVGRVMDELMYATELQGDSKNIPFVINNNNITCFYMDIR
jgi:hypothetical protein